MPCGRLSLCLGSLSAAGRLFRQLVDLFQFYQYFPMDDHTGDPISDEAQVQLVVARTGFAHSCFAWAGAASAGTTRRAMPVVFGIRVPRCIVVLTALPSILRLSGHT